MSQNVTGELSLKELFAVPSNSKIPGKLMVGHHNINVFYNTVGLQKYCADILFAFFGGGVLNIVTFKTFYRSFYDMKGQNSILKIHQ